MKSDLLVSSRVLGFLFDPLIFLDSYQISENIEDWRDPNFIEKFIADHIEPGFLSFDDDFKIIIRNSLEYSIAVQPEKDPIIEYVWQHSQAYIPTPLGELDFFKRCYKILFKNQNFTAVTDISKYKIDNSAKTAMYFMQKS